MLLLRTADSSDLCVRETKKVKSTRNETQSTEGAPRSEQSINHAATVTLHPAPPPSDTGTRPTFLNLSCLVLPSSASACYPGFPWPLLSFLPAFCSLILSLSLFIFLCLGSFNVSPFVCGVLHVYSCISRGMYCVCARALDHCRGVVLVYSCVCSLMSFSLCHSFFVKTLY